MSDIMAAPRKDADGVQKIGTVLVEPHSHHDARMVSQPMRALQVYRTAAATQVMRIGRAIAKLARKERIVLKMSPFQRHAWQETFVQIQPP
jgi:hypothetical protein